MANLGPVSIKPSDTVYIVPAKTDVMVSNDLNVLRDYTTKNENMFSGTCIVIGSGIKFELGNKLVGVNVSASSLLDSGYHTFMTGNVEWPYMVVKKSVFDDFGSSSLPMPRKGEWFGRSAKPVGSVDKMIRNSRRPTVEIDKELKERLSPLTKKQEKKIRKKSFCPDCLGNRLDERTWSKIDSHIVCMDCKSEFRLTDTTIERL